MILHQDSYQTFLKNEALGDIITASNYIAFGINQIKVFL